MSDEQLRRSIATQPAPALSPEFERRLSARLGQRKLSSKTGRVLLAYAVLGILVSLAAMYASGTPWWVAGLSVLVPLVVVGAICRPYLTLFRRS